MKPKIKLLLDNVHMGLSHDGLAKLCEQRPFRLKLESLAGDELVMFMNRAKDKLKIIGHKGFVIGYIRMPKGRKIMVEAIQWLPATFGGHGFDYDAALKKALEERLLRSATKSGPLQAYRAMERSGLTARTNNQQHTS